LAGHDGRQNIPVLETPKTNVPSSELSRSRTACQRRAFIGCGVDFIASSESIALVAMQIT
jgi:hypothetical protein